MVKQSRRREKELLEARVVSRALDELQTPSVKLKPGANTGWPDREYFVAGGVPLLHEYKWPGYEPDPRQVYIHDMLRELGYDVQVHTDEEEALAAIRSAKANTGRRVGAKHPMWGRNHTEESKRKISEGLKKDKLEGRR